MKHFIAKVVLVMIFCAFFTLGVPIMLTAAQENLLSLGWGIMFVFCAICLYLVMTSEFFEKKETLQIVSVEN